MHINFNGNEEKVEKGSLIAAVPHIIAVKSCSTQVAKNVCKICLFKTLKGKTRWQKHIWGKKSICGENF
jgi:hypothetical protein